MKVFLINNMNCDILSFFKEKKNNSTKAEAEMLYNCLCVWVCVCVNEGYR